MENTNHVGGDVPPLKRLYYADVLGRALADHLVGQGVEANLSPEALAVVLEAAAVQLGLQAQVLRSR